MNFEEWKKTKKALEFCNEHTHLLDKFNSYRRIDCEECIWQAAQEEKSSPFFVQELIKNAKAEDRKELAREALAKHNFYKTKVSEEKQLNDLVELLEKEASK